MNDYTKKLRQFYNIACKKEADYTDLLKESYSEERKKSKGFYTAMLKHKKEVWVNAVVLYFSLYKSVYKELL